MQLSADTMFEPILIQSNLIQSSPIQSSPIQPLWIHPTGMRYARCVIYAGLCAILSFNVDLHAQTRPTVPTATKEAIMTTHASGSFEVKLNPLEVYNKSEGSNLARMSIDKQFQGDLTATSKGEMLSAMTDTKGSAGYVAIEKVTGTLHGRSGSFVLQHNATMTRGAPYLNIVVVPDSGTGELVGLTGKMLIIITDGKHSYEFDYAL